MVLLRSFTNISFGGEKDMSDFIWYWTDGNKKVYTKKTDVAEKAMRNGMLVMGMRARPDIIKF